MRLVFIKEILVPLSVELRTCVNLLAASSVKCLSLSLIGKGRTSSEDGGEMRIGIVYVEICTEIIAFIVERLA